MNYSETSVRGGRDPNKTIFSKKWTYHLSIRKQSYQMDFTYAQWKNIYNQLKSAKSKISYKLKRWSKQKKKQAEISWICLCASWAHQSFLLPFWGALLDLLRIFMRFLDMKYGFWRDPSFRSKSSTVRGKDGKVISCSVTQVDATNF